MNTERWEIDSSHSGIHFSVRHLVIAKVRGQFSRWTGTVLVPDGDFGTRALDVVDRHVQHRHRRRRPRHAPAVRRLLRRRAVSRRSRFKSDARRAARQATGSALVGDLTIKGVTREVVLDVEQLGPPRIRGATSARRSAPRPSIDRKEFGLTWNQVLETGGVMVGDRIEIEIDIEAVRQVATKVA